VGGYSGRITILICTSVACALLACALGALLLATLIRWRLVVARGIYGAGFASGLGGCLLWLAALQYAAGSGGSVTFGFPFYVVFIPLFLITEAGLSGFLAASSRLRYYSLALGVLGGFLAVRLLIHRFSP